MRPARGEAARLYRLGLTVAEIAVMFGVSAWAVAARLDRAGVARRARGQEAGLLPVERAVRRYRRQPHRSASWPRSWGSAPR